MASAVFSMPSNSEISVDHLPPSSINETSIEHESANVMPSGSWSLDPQSSDPAITANQLKAGTIGQIVTDKEPPKDAKFIFESPTTKYYTLPTVSTSEKTTVSISAPKKLEGIGPLNESGVPLSLRTVKLYLLQKY